MKYLILSDTVSFMNPNNVEKINAKNKDRKTFIAAMCFNEVPNLNILYIDSDDIYDLKDFCLKDIVINISTNKSTLIINKYEPNISTDIINIEGFDIDNINSITITTLYKVIENINTYYDMYLDCYIDITNVNIMDAIISLCKFIKTNDKDIKIQNANIKIY